MKKYLYSSIGRLRIIAFLEGISLILLLCIAMPLKYMFGYTDFARTMGQVHGILFLLFVFYTLQVGIEQRWTFRSVTWKVLLACMVPLGSFYIDRQILSKIHS